MRIRFGKIVLMAVIVAAVGVMLTACAAPGAATTAAPADLLSQIQARGTLVISTDPAYPPQSELVEGATRAANTKCTADQHTANEMHGFDIDVAVAIAKGLGVEPCFVTPDWTLITGGSWSGRWDISVGSMTITPQRMQVLYFTQPYYTTPAQLYVNKDNTSYTQPSDLSGKKIGVCTGCTYETYLNGTLSIPGETIDFVIKNADVKGYDTDVPALQDLALGDGVRLDAVLTASPTGDDQISKGLAIKPLGDPLFFEYLAGAVDKQSQADPIPFLHKVTDVINGLHSDGTLSALSQQYFGSDLASAAASFDWAALNQP